MSPLEILALFIDGLRWSGERKWREPTAFEVSERDLTLGCSGEEAGARWTAHG